MKARLSSVVGECGVLAMLAVGCTPAPDSANTQADGDLSYSCNAHLNISQRLSNSSYEQWHLLVPRAGAWIWNGQNVDGKAARRYMMELSRMPANAGKLTIHIQPGTSCEVIAELRLILENSPLCLQNRCVQDRWDYQRPIVN